jgi:diadenylate cyclase
MLRDIFVLGYQPLLEIALIAAGIFVLLRFLRSAQGGSMLRGMLFLGGLTFAFIFLIAKRVGLERISWLFEHLVGVSVIAVLIVLQPEMRRGLVRIGRNPLVQFLLRQPRSHPIEAIVETAVTLSKKRVGALIAIERNDGLNQYVETAVPMDAAVTKELLGTIFYEGTPLHDGAAVIRGSRVAGAGCLFPLSENPELSKSMGTRHRAAIGITEECDAVTVVVSEETGSVSVCVGGEITTGLDGDAQGQVVAALLVEQRLRLGGRGVGQGHAVCGGRHGGAIRGGRGLRLIGNSHCVSLMRMSVVWGSRGG